MSDMKLVFVVENSDESWRCIFSTEEKAEEYLERHAVTFDQVGLTIQRWAIDAN